VTAANAAGPGAASEASAAVTPAGVPDRPVVDAVTVVAANRLSVAFTAGADHGSAITAFDATCSSGDGGTTRSATGASSPLVVDGLTTGSTYTCAVVARNAAGSSSASEPSAGVISAHLLSIAPPAAGTGTVTSDIGALDCPSACSAAFAPGTVVTLTASPAAGWELSRWGGACSGASATCSVVASAARQVEAVFVQSPTSTTGAPPPAGVAWSVQDLAIVAAFRGTAGIAYAIRATQGAAVRTGTCTWSGAAVRCSVGVTAGVWVAVITPSSESIAGTEVSRSMTVTRVERLRAVDWRTSAGGTTVAATFKAAAGTRYAIAATLKGSVVKGRCTIARGAVSCAVPTKRPGRWVVSITPSRNGSLGKPVTRTVLVAR